MLELLGKRYRLANLPTPVDYYRLISDKLGIKLYIKRDDLTESVASGNKIRKIEYLVRDAMDKGADTLVTCGGVQSNHCRAVAWAAARLGLSSVLLLRGEEPAEAQGNLLLDRMLNSEIHFFSVEEFKNLSSHENRIMEELRGQGKTPYLIPMGGSNATGTLGYIHMMKEIADSGEEFDHIYTALGSGGTFAGIWLGNKLFDLNINVQGVAVCDDREYFLKEIHRIQGEFSQWYSMSTDFTGIGESIDEDHVGIGYAQNTDSEISELIDYAAAEGLILDPVYTLKAFLGMVSHCKKGKIKPNDRVLFVHTGGHTDLFPKNEEIARLL